MTDSSALPAWSPTGSPTRSPVLPSPMVHTPTPVRIAESVLARDGHVTTLADFHRWLSDLRDRSYTHVERTPLTELTEWCADPETGNISHRSGKFFTVEGLEVEIPDGPVPHWYQPIINQPEVGILGILVKEFDGILHCLMQAKAEPGNANGLQLSPTVQATRSNYTRVHRGQAVPYLEYFLNPAQRRVLADVRQSEQGSAFRHKRNRNMLVEVTHDVPLLDGFCWLSLGQIHRLLGIDDLVNMDTRTVLACLPFAHNDLTDILPCTEDHNDDGFTAALARSCSRDSGGLHTMDEILSWITEVRTRTEIRTQRVPLRDLPGWRRTAEKISHHSGRFFDVIGVSVTAAGREIAEWTQPMIQPHGTGVVAFLVTRIRGVLHALVHAKVEPGYLDVLELAPTVQCTPENYEYLPAAARPRFLDEVLSATADQIRYETLLSEEGGRFYHARNRYLIIEAEVDVRPDDPDYRWLTLHQLVDLLRHSHYVNIQARSLVACLHSLSGQSGRAAGPRQSTTP